MTARAMTSAALSSALLFSLACADTTAPSEAVQYRVTTEIKIRDRTGTLRVITPATLEAAGISASRRGATPDAPMFVSARATGAIYHATAGRVNAVTRARDGHRHQISVLYKAGGGPPAIVQNYVDGKIATITHLTWTRTAGGWVRTNAVMQAVTPKQGSGVPYTVEGVVTTSARPCRGSVAASCGPIRMGERHTLAGGLYALLGACTTTAYAQGWANMSWSVCRSEWILYGISAAGLAVAAVALGACPECGATEAAFAGAMGATAAALDKLVGCMVSDPGGGLRGYTGGSSGGGGGTSSSADDSGGIIAWVQ